MHKRVWGKLGARESIAPLLDTGRFCEVQMSPEPMKTGLGTEEKSVRVDDLIAT